MGRSFLDLSIASQPTDTVCGQTCLYSLYRYFNHDVTLESVIASIEPLPLGGTLAVQLGCHALGRGFLAKLYTNNLQIFDPSWFQPASAASPVDLSAKLRRQVEVKKGDKLRIATDAYLRFLELGGQIQLEGLTPRLLRNYINRKIPILAGLSATYLYQCPRESDEGEYDDIGGTPTGHFVIILGYDDETGRVRIADPLTDNHPFDGPYYSVDLQRLLTAIALGIVTYDANILVLIPPEEVGK